MLRSLRRFRMLLLNNVGAAVVAVVGPAGNMLLEGGVDRLLLEDGTSIILLEG